MTVLAFLTVQNPLISIAEGPAFSISAIENTASGSSLINVSLEGINLDDLYAYEAVLSFDNEKLELIKSKSELKGFSVSPKIEGNKAYIAFTKVGNVDGEKGNMKLSTITFRGKASGRATIKLESVKTVDSKLSLQTYTPGKVILVAVRRLSLVLEPVIDNETGVATAVLSMEQIENLLSEAEANLLGVRTIEIEILPVEGASEYVLRFPVEALTNPALNTYFIIRTPLGIIQIPGNMLTKEMVNNAGYASIKIGTANTGNFNEILKKQIGERPVITLQVDLDGKVIARNDHNTAIRVIIPYHPTVEEAADYEHIVVLYIDQEGNAKVVETGVFNNQQETVGFAANYFGTFAVSFAKKTFDDIINHWSQQYVEVMASRGIIKGLPGNIFGINYDITRADYVTLLVRMLGISATVETNFDDVLPEDYFYHTVGIAKKIGIVKNDENLFRPRDPITREEMMMFTASALKYVVPETSVSNYDMLSQFSDVSLISPEALESAAILVEKKIIVGAGGKLMPKEKMTRAEAATVLYRLFNIIWSE